MNVTIYTCVYVSVGVGVGKCVWSECVQMSVFACA